MKYWDRLTRERIYDGLHNVKFPNNGVINGSPFISDFINHHLNYHYYPEEKTFVQLGHMIQGCLRTKNFTTWQCECQTSNIGTRVNRLQILQHKLNDLQYEIDCIRNND